MGKKISSLLVTVAVIVTGAVTTHRVIASDHDDGESDDHARALNLTDVYTFREDWHSGQTADKANLVFVVNTNPRSLPQQQYYFSSAARYELHIKRATNTVAYTTGEDVTFRFEFALPLNPVFGAAAAYHQQAMTFTSIKDGGKSVTKTTSDGSQILTTPLGASAVTNTVALGDYTARIFAGLREDPFFFDIERFFKIRSALASSSGTSIGSGFGSTYSEAEDFAAGYNVNSIVLALPIAYLQSTTTDTTFDVWATISIPK